MIRVIQFKRLVAEYMMRIQMSAGQPAHASEEVDTKIFEIVTLLKLTRPFFNKKFFKFIHTFKGYRGFWPSISRLKR